MSLSNQNIVIAGYSGHAFVVIDILREQGKSVSGYLEREKKRKNPYRIPFLGDENDAEVLEQLGKETQIALGIGINRIRESVFKKLNDHPFSLPAIKSPSASVSDLAEVGKASFVNRSASVNALAVIGNAVIINTGAVIEHECKLGDFCHIAPGAVLAGNVSVGHRSFVGANSIVKEGVTIGDDALIGAGAVVLNNVPDGEKWVGNPAKVIQ